MIKRSVLAVLLATLGAAGCVSALPECPRDTSPATEKLIAARECKCVSGSPLCSEKRLSEGTSTPQRSDPSPSPSPGKP